MVFLFTVSLNATLFAQEKQKSHKSRQGKLDTTGLIIKSKNNLKRIQAYGSLRVYMGISSEGRFGVKDGASRVGIKGRTEIKKGIDVIALLEVGVNGIDNNLDIVFHADPGNAVGEFDETVTARLMKIGLETKIGDFTWGKQWSPYYDVGGFSDQSMAFGGEAQGTFPSGTDGGIPGTGRAANSMQYRANIKNLKVGLQAQFRDVTKGNVKFADTYAISLVYDNPIGVSVGVAYNNVRDGVEDTVINKSHMGDEAAIAGFLIHKKQVTIAGTFSVLTEHEQDDQLKYYSGNGYEFFVIYQFLKRWHALSGINYLKPYGNAHGQFQVKYLMLGVSYYFTKTSLIFLEAKFEDSKHVDGSKRKSILGFGIHYDF